MVNYQSGALDATFAALADPTRRAILARLARGEASVGELARPFQVSLPAISKHLRALEEARLIGRRRDGRTHRIHLKARRLREAAEWIRRHEEFWRNRLDALQAYLEGEGEGGR
jgi:DNA-binding transcriptional ArsR family regulator